MNTKILNINVNPAIIDDADKDKYTIAGDIIKKGGLVAFPTETVYGLGGDALRAESSEKIYAAKGRPSDNPLIVHIAEFDALAKIASDIPENAYKLNEAFWPGPLTMVLNKTDAVPLSTTGGLDTVAVRMPSDVRALEFIKASGGYIAAPSANLSGRPSPTKAGHVVEDLSGRIDMILDGGDVEIGLESTIVDLTGDIPMILRPGFITKEDLERVCGEVLVDKAIIAPESGLKPKAPGMKYRHYAPKGDLTIAMGDREAVKNFIKNEIDGHKEDRVGVIVFAEDAADYSDADSVFVLGHKDSKREMAKNLYDVLRRCDDENLSYIYIEGVDENGFGSAVMNRMKKAAGGKIIYV